MKNEKLDLLLNKVVEYNKPDVAHYRGFLYKDGGQYFIKIVEVDSGDFKVNDRDYLTDGDEEKFITQSDKPKLMRISLKSWHYRLIKFVLRSNAPTPNTMQNGCPYFWLLIFSLLVLPFVLIWKVFVFILLLFPRGMIWFLENITYNWMMKLEDTQVYDIYYGRGNSYTKMPKTAKIFFDHKSDENFFDYFLNEKYNLDSKISPIEYWKKKNELAQKWSDWKKGLDELRTKRNHEFYMKEMEIKHKKAERQILLEKRKAEWDVKMKPINDKFKSIGVSIKKAFTFNPSTTKNIIKNTKQFVGALITLFLLTVTYFVVSFITYSLTAIIDLCIQYWYVFVMIAVIAAIVGIIYVLYILVSGWLQTIVNKYSIGKKIWYIEPLIYLLWYPVKYIVLAIVYGFYYIICIPIEYIFYIFLWKAILVNIGKLLWKILCSLGHGLVNSTGIFGEYFNASYTDYCPGIEWVDTDEESNN